MTQVFEVENIKCSGCMNTIRKGLEQTPGVRSALPENVQGTVTIEFDENMLTAASLEQKLSEMGYPPTGENSLGRKAKSYVSCMIGRITAAP